MRSKPAVNIQADGHAFGKLLDQQDATAGDRRKARAILAKSEAVAERILAARPETMADVVVQLAIAGTLGHEAVDLAAEGDECKAVERCETLERILLNAASIVARAANFDLRTIGMTAHA